MSPRSTFRIAVIGSGTTGLAAALGLATAAAKIAESAARSGAIKVVLIAPATLETSLGEGKPTAGIVRKRRKELGDVTLSLAIPGMSSDVRAIDLWPTAFSALARLGNGSRPLQRRDGPSDRRTAAYQARADERLTGFWRDTTREEGQGEPLERYDFRSTTGQLLWSMPAGTYGRELGCSPRVVTLEQVHKALRDTLIAAKAGGPGSPKDPPPAPIEWIGAEVTGVTWRADASRVEVLVSYPSGVGRDKPELEVFDLVVAADGASALVHREARIAWGAKGQLPARRDEDKRLFPDTHATRRTTGTVVVSGIAGRKPGDGKEKYTWEAVGGDLVRAGQGVVIHGQDLRFGAWRSPEGEERGAVRWNAFVPREVALPIARGTFGDGHDEDAEEAFAARLTAARTAAGDWKPLVDLRDRLRDAFVDFPDTVDRLLALTRTQDLAVHLPADRAPDRAHWVAGRVVLLGDSAHPMLPDLGLACTMAFEDAASLAETLERLAYEHDGLPEPTPDGDERLGEALAAWRDGRFSRVAEVVSSSRLAHETVHAPVELPQWARDLMIAAMVPPAATQGKEKWFTPH